jgi:hypothetical protein
MNLTIEVERIARDGMTNSKNPKPYYILDCFATLPGIKHPQACQLFSSKPLNAGFYSVPLVASIRDRKPSFDLDFSAATPAAKAAAA